MNQYMENLHVRLSLSQRKHGGDDGKTEDDGGNGGGGSSSGGGGGPGPGPGTQTPPPTTSPPQTTTVTTISTFVSISTKPAQGNNGSSSNGPTPTPGPVRAPPSPTQSGSQSGSNGLNVAPTTQINQDTSSPATSPVPGSSSSGGSPPSSSGSSSSSVVFVLNNPANTTVCESLLLSWSYVGQSPIFLTLAVQAQNSPFGNDATASLPSPSQPRILSTNISSSAANYHWNPVDVKEGWYNAQAYNTANTTGISASSSPFFVAQGSDTTCLLALGPTQSSTPSAPHPSDTTRIPIGDIVGIALGVTAGVLGLITAFVLPRMKKRTHDSKPLLGTPKTITKKKWPRLLY